MMPLVHKKNTDFAAFIGAQSLHKPAAYDDPDATANANLAARLPYLFATCRFAHYLKCIMRDNIGSTAHAQYIHNQIDNWISRYVTALVNPDDLTLRYYPFKAYSLNVQEVPGKLGWYKCDLSILPHVQFEGMDVELRVDARLG